MSLSNRRTFVLGLAGLTAACGFEPVYAPGSAAAALRNTVLVDPPSDPVGFELVQELERRFGEPRSAQYRLSANLAMAEDSIGVTADGTISRFRLRGRADYAVIDPVSDQVLTRGKAESFTTYSATSTTVATRSAKRDAERRLMVILADQMVTRLSTTAEDWA